MTYPVLSVDYSIHTGSSSEHVSHVSVHRLLLQYMIRYLRARPNEEKQ